MGTPLIRAMKLPIPVLVDRDRTVYRAYGLDKRLMVQQSATFIVERGGTLRYARASFNPWASFEPREVREVLAQLTSSSR
jgi:peroxiredoxin